MELYLHSAIRLHSMVCNRAQEQPCPLFSILSNHDFGCQAVTDANPASGMNVYPRFVVQVEVLVWIDPPLKESP
jgi:hypothetical protein